MNVSLSNFNNRRAELRDSLNKIQLNDFNVVEKTDAKDAITIQQIINDSKIYSAVTDDVIKTKLLENGITNTDEIITSLKDISLIDQSIKLFANRIDKFSKSPKALEKIITKQKEIVKKTDRLNNINDVANKVLEKARNAAVENKANDLTGVDLSKPIPTLSDINEVDIDMDAASDEAIKEFNEAVERNDGSVE